MRIGLDFDGVISDCGALKCAAAKKLYGVDIPSERFKKELVVGGGLLTMQQYKDLQQTIYGTWDVGLTLLPVDGVLEAVPRLRDAGHSLRVITSRDGVQLEIARAWAAKHGLALDFTGVGYGSSKTGAAEGLDLYVDDDLDKLEPLIGIVPRRLLFSWGYNSHVDAGGIAERVASWKEIMDIVAANERP
ncbi:MAG: 5 nucleotidase, deoxy (Pyrimidine), cytosolic type protein [Candidatus Parcubacteria bacterium]|jgi:hypothetical protein